MKISIITFGMPPIYNRRVETGEDKGTLIRFMEERGFDFIQNSITTAGDLDLVVKKLWENNVKCLIFNLKHWGRNALMVQLARRMDLPLALFCHTQNGLSGVTITTSASGILREMDFSRNINLHERFSDKMLDELYSWIRGVCALTQLRESRVMCWGGSYGAEMSYTRSDADGIENLLIAEVLVEPEKVLTDRADEIVKNQSERISRFYDWGKGCGLKVEKDNIMITEDSMEKQAAIYLAARDRLAELSDENIRGVSIKCHFDLSITDWGCTACTLPAFLPFGVDSEGAKTIVPTACEGDLNGLIGLLILQNLNQNTPPLFGDLVEYRREFILLRNCGSSSVYWAGQSLDPAETLSKVTFKPNIHGKSGVAVSYETPAVDKITLLRLFRLRGKFCVIFGEGKILNPASGSIYTDPWPHTRIDLGVDNDLLFKVFPCNHASLTIGNHAKSIETVCRLTGINIYRCDSDEGLIQLQNDIRGV
jgi:L-fucose/D-arabinose isomerase